MADNPTPVPAAIPWYKSQQLQAILTIVFTQIVARISAYLQAKYQFDVAVLGITPGDLVTWTMDGLSGLGVYWATHARVTQKVAPAIVATQAKADVINTAAGGKK